MDGWVREDEKYLNFFLKQEEMYVNGWRDCVVNFHMRIIFFHWRGKFIFSRRLSPLTVCFFHVSYFWKSVFNLLLTRTDTRVLIHVTANFLFYCCGKKEQKIKVCKKVYRKSDRGRHLSPPTFHLFHLIRGDKKKKTTYRLCKFPYCHRISLFSNV